MILRRLKLFYKYFSAERLPSSQDQTSVNTTKTKKL